jgi:bifunctional DNA-binding transcriptional regulator/antitoxin component of YhaV-PrlF toxin-antitoxin module
MLVKLSSRNRLTIPKAIMRTLGAVRGFAVELRDGKIFLSPAYLQRADAVRSKLAELQLDSDDVAAALEWTRG